MHDAVEHPQQVRGVGVVQRLGAQRVAHEPGQRRRLRALALHVADRDDEAPAGRRHDVVEVPADLVAVPRRAIDRGDVDPGDLGQMGGQQAALERRGDVALALVQRGPVERRPGLGEEQLEQAHVLVGQPPRHAEREQRAAPHLAADADRGGDPRAVPRPLEDVRPGRVALAQLAPADHRHDPALPHRLRQRRRVRQRQVAPVERLALVVAVLGGEPQLGRAPLEQHDDARLRPQRRDPWSTTTWATSPAPAAATAGS